LHLDGQGPDHRQRRGVWCVWRRSGQQRRRLGGDPGSRSDGRVRLQFRRSHDRCRTRGNVGKRPTRPRSRTNQRSSRPRGR